MQLKKACLRTSAEVNRIFGAEGSVPGPVPTKDKDAPQQPAEEESSEQPF